MGCLRRIPFVLALVLALLAPTMTCALPYAEMTTSEHACCKKMKGNCGSMRMPASHSCCQHSMQGSYFTAVQPESAFVPSAVAIAVLPLPVTFDLRSPTFERIALQQHSLPISPPPTVSVLRI